MSGVKSQEELDFEFALKMQEEERQHGKSREEVALEGNNIKKNSNNRDVNSRIPELNPTIIILFW
jgi:hypothetical protein